MSPFLLGETGIVACSSRNCQKNVEVFRDAKSWPGGLSGRSWARLLWPSDCRRSAERHDAHGVGYGDGFRCRTRGLNLDRAWPHLATRVKRPIGRARMGLPLE